MTTETKSLHEQRAAIVIQMQAILDKAKTDSNRSLSEDEDVQWNKLDDEQERMSKDILRIKNLYELSLSEKERLLQAGKKEGTSADEQEGKEKEELRAFTNYIVKGYNGMNESDRVILRAQSKGTTTEGGFLVPEGFQAELTKALLKFGGVREVARILNTATGNDIPWPNINDTANSAAIVSENSDSLTTPDLVFGSTTLKAWMYRTSLIRVSKELLMDSAINIQQVITDALAERLARGTNAGFTTGNGTTAPEGVVTGAGAGKTTASETAFTVKEWMDFEHSLDAAYRANAKFMFHDNTLKELKKLTVGSSDDRPVWNPGIVQANAPSTILGYPYVINNDMASSLVADAKVALFGDFSYYIVRDILGINIVSLAERYAEFLQTAFLGFSRHDGRYIASDTPVKYLIMANT